MGSSTERERERADLAADAVAAAIQEAEVEEPSTAMVVPPPAGAGPLDREWAEWLVDSARAEGLELVGPDGVLAGITRQVLEAALEAELTDHLGYEKHSPLGRGSGNSRNGATAKSVHTGVGKLRVRVPRDRNGSFEPAIVPKGARRLDGFGEQVISLYSRGMTTGEIQGHLQEIYGTSISRDTISRITDAVVDELTEWQNRPLDPVWPVIFIDAIYTKIRDGQVANRPIYVVMGVSTQGQRDVLGMWVGPTGGEGAKFWGGVLTELRNRGIVDVCIACCDGLVGLPDAINATWPEALVQTCVVHLVRNTLRYTGVKDWPKLAADMRTIYTAPTIEAAEARFEEFCERWAERYPKAIDVWRRRWAEFVPFLAFPAEVRDVVYTTNTIESLNARFRRAIYVRGHFPNEQAALKVLYLTIRTRDPKGGNPVAQTPNWKRALNAFAMHFGDRITIH
jgi:transposase-like protein